MAEQNTGTDTNTNANIAAVEKFLFALRDEDLDTADSLLDDNLVYQNVGFSTIRGRQRTMRLFAAMKQRQSLGFDVKFHRVAGDGDTVLTERTDVLVFGPVRVIFWVCGVFELSDGRITLWRDYFDTVDMAKGLVRGLAAAVVPALQRTF